MGCTVPESEPSSDDDYTVQVSMNISKKGQTVETKKIDFGHLREAHVRGLTDLFTVLAQNVEYIKKLAPQFEKLDKSKPGYLQ